MSSTGKVWNCSFWYLSLPDNRTPAKSHVLSSFLRNFTPKSAILVHFGWYTVYWYTGIPRFKTPIFWNYPFGSVGIAPIAVLVRFVFWTDLFWSRARMTLLGTGWLKLSCCPAWHGGVKCLNPKGGKHVERRWNKGVSISMLDCYFVVHTKQCEPVPQWRYILMHQVFGSALLDGRWYPQPFLPRAKDDFSQESSKLQHRKSSCGLPHDSFLKSLEAFGTAGRIPFRLRVYHSCHIHKWRGFRRCSCVDLRTDLGMDQNPAYLIFGLNLHVPARGSPGYQCFEPSPPTKMSTPLSQLYLIWALWLHHDFF